MPMNHSTESEVRRAAKAFLATCDKLADCQRHGTHSCWLWVKDSASKYTGPLADAVMALPPRPIPNGPAANAWADEALPALHAALAGPSEADKPTAARRTLANPDGKATDDYTLYAIADDDLARIRPIAERAGVPTTMWIGDALRAAIEAGESDG